MAASPETWFRSAVEAAAGCPVFPVEADEGIAAPFVVFSMDEESRLNDLSGPILWSTTVFGLTIYARGYTEVVSIARAIIAAVDNFSGEGDGAIIESVQLTGHVDGPAVKFEGHSDSCKTRELAFSVLWKE